MSLSKSKLNSKNLDLSQESGLPNLESFDMISGMTTTSNMFSKVKHAGRTLLEWREIFNNMFSLGELYQMHLENRWPVHPGK